MISSNIGVVPTAYATSLSVSVVSPHGTLTAHCERTGIERSFSFIDDSRQLNEGARSRPLNFDCGHDLFEFVKACE
jgi:hypothetical protein